MSMTLISTVTIGAGGAASIDFSGIAGNGTDLLLLCSTRTDRASTPIDVLTVRFNNDTNSANYSVRYLGGTGSSTISGSTSGYNSFAVGSLATSLTFGSTQVVIPNYAGVNKKSFWAEGFSENNNSTAYMGVHANTWTGTSAITSIKITSYNAANFLSGSTVSLYSVKKGSGGATAA